MREDRISVAGSRICPAGSERRDVAAEEPGSERELWRVVDKAVGHRDPIYREGGPLQRIANFENRYRAGCRKRSSISQQGIVGRLGELVRDAGYIRNVEIAGAVVIGDREDDRLLVPVLH